MSHLIKISKLMGLHHEKTLETHIKHVVYYIGKLSHMLPIHQLKKGDVVITPRGVGIVHMSYPFKGPSKARDNKVVVMFNKRYFTFNYDEVYQYVVLHTPLNTYFPLAKASYSYILHDGVEVQYRITSRNNAMLSDEEKTNRLYIKLANDIPGGRKLLLKYEKEGYKIVKQ
jgi:hypothetical protein